VLVVLLESRVVVARQRAHDGVLERLEGAQHLLPPQVGAADRLALADGARLDGDEGLLDRAAFGVAERLDAHRRALRHVLLDEVEALVDAEVGVGRDRLELLHVEPAQQQRARAVPIPRLVGAREPREARLADRQPQHVEEGVAVLLAHDAAPPRPVGEREAAGRPCG